MTNETTMATTRAWHNYSASSALFGVVSAELTFYAPSIKQALQIRLSNYRHRMRCRHLGGKHHQQSRTLVIQRSSVISTEMARNMEWKDSQLPVSCPTIPLTQSDEPDESGPRLRAEAAMGNVVPPKVRLMLGKESHGTMECQ